jgi:hypothetical protein
VTLATRFASWRSRGVAGRTPGSRRKRLRDPVRAPPQSDHPHDPVPPTRRGSGSRRSPTVLRSHLGLR